MRGGVEVQGSGERCLPPHHPQVVEEEDEGNSLLLLAREHASQAPFEQIEPARNDGVDRVRPVRGMSGRSGRLLGFGVTGCGGSNLAGHGRQREQGSFPKGGFDLQERSGVEVPGIRIEVRHDRFTGRGDPLSEGFPGGQEGGRQLRAPGDDPGK